jgi:hypothetical protein
MIFVETTVCLSAIENVKFSFMVQMRKPEKMAENPDSLELKLSWYSSFGGRT